MLDQSSAVPVVPVTDLERARAFYEEKLGLHPTTMYAHPGSLLLNAGNGTCVQLDVRDPDQVKAINETEHTLFGFEVDDIEIEVKGLEKLGVKFEDYDLPDLKTEDHIASMDGEKAAWLKDPDGNVICIHQPRPSS